MKSFLNIVAEYWPLMLAGVGGIVLGAKVILAFVNVILLGQ